VNLRPFSARGADTPHTALRRMKALTFPIPSLSLVFLMYNEAENVGPVLREALDYCRQELEEWEILVVDDGSSDSGPDVVRAMMADEPRIRLVQHEHNQGMGGGMRTGIANVQCDYFVFLPADGQIDPWELRKMIPLLAGGEIVVSIYPHRHSTVKRAIMSRAFRDFMQFAANIRFQLEGLYLYPTAAAREFMPRVMGRTFFVSFDLIQRATENGMSVVMTTIDVRPRRTGSSKVTSPGAILKVAREVWEYRERRKAE
jgi:glycosyltransferase involved in cell wall biosynthesis